MKRGIAEGWVVRVNDPDRAKRNKKLATVCKSEKDSRKNYYVDVRVLEYRANSALLLVGCANPGR